MYNWSIWNVERDIEPGVMVLNTFSGAGVILTHGQYQLLKNNTFNELEETLINNLIENGFLVPYSPSEEASLYWSLYNNVVCRSVYDELFLTLIPTYRCNLACKYCFEDHHYLEKLSDVPQNERLEFPMLEKFIENYYNEFHFKKARIVFYGGEPLLFPEHFLNITQQLHKWLKEKGVNFSFSIVTNGTIYSERIIDALIELGLEKIQITLDGPENIHDERRPFLSGKGSFNVIFEHIKKIVEKNVNVIVRINVDAHNTMYVQDLIRLFKENNLLSQKNFSFYQGLVDPSTAGQSWCNEYVPLKLNDRIPLIGRVWSKMIEVTDDTQLLIGLNGLNFGVCPAKIHGAFFIGPDGDMFSCYSLVGNKNFVVGNCREGKVYPLYRELLFYGSKKIIKCIEVNCPYLPLCNGGCFYHSYAEYGTPQEIACQRKYFEEVWLRAKGSIYEKIYKEQTGRKTPLYRRRHKDI
ncbi:MAG: radical SAM protein [Candidatus Hydrothermia bacterium]